jgi:GT2 family glycosyltransferase
MESPPRHGATDPAATAERDPSVYVVVLNWNRWDATQASVKALAAVDYEPKRVVVVDNGSDDPPDRADALAAGADDFLQTGANLGYAGGNNLGIRRAIAAGAEFLWVVNNDTVADPSSLAELVAAAVGNPSAGVLTTNVRSPGGELERDVAYTGTSRDAPWDYFGELHPVDCDGCDRGFHASVGVRGPSLFFRAAALADEGLFDEEYFHYYEEIDLVERLRRKGWGSGLACRAALAHASGTTLSYETGQSIYYLFRNYLYFRKKLYGESALRIIVRHPARVARYVFSARQMLRGELRPTRAHLLALVDASRGRLGRRQLGATFQERFRFER